jgi:hypothetical protein
VLSLLVIPSVFTVVDDLEHWLGRIQRRLLREKPAAQAMPRQ